MKKEEARMKKHMGAKPTPYHKIEHLSTDNIVCLLNSIFGVDSVSGKR